MIKNIINKLKCYWDDNYCFMKEVSLEEKLLVAVKAEEVNIVEHLLQKGADPNKFNEDEIYSTPLFYSLVYHRSPKIEMIAILLMYGADPLLSKDKEGSPTPLYIAKVKKYDHIVKLMEEVIDKDLSPTQKKRKKLMQDLKDAIKYEDKSEFKSLILQTVSQFTTEEKQDNYYIILIREILDYASYEGKYEMFTWVFKTLVPSHLRRGVLNKKYLHELVKDKSFISIKEFLDMKAIKKIDLNSRNNEGETMLHTVARRLMADAMIYLANKGADISLKTTKGKTAWRLYQEAKSPHQLFEGEKEAEVKKIFNGG